MDDKEVGLFWDIARKGLTEGPYKTMLVNLIRKLVVERIDWYARENRNSVPPSYGVLLAKTLADFGIEPVSFTKDDLHQLGPNSDRK